MRVSSRGRPSGTIPHSSAAVVACVIGVALVSSCTNDAPTSAPEAQVSMCRGSGTAASIVGVSQSQVAERRRQGDYLVNFVVTKQAGQPTDSAHFSRIGDAVAAARAGRLARGETQSSGCQITITVAAGTFRGTATASTDTTLEHFPIIVDVPGIALRGAFVMGMDATGRATGVGAGRDLTTISPAEPLMLVGGASSQTGSSTPIIIANGHPGGSAGNGLTIEGFVFQSGHAGVDTLAGGQGVFAMRVQNLVIRGNRFEAGFTESMDLRATSASVLRNQLSGTGGTCDICIAGPGAYTVADNRLLAGATEGISAVAALNLPVPAAVEQFDLPSTSTIVATITNNEVRDHLRKPVGSSVRVGAIGVGAPDVRGTSVVTIINNALINNNFAIIVEGAFPVASTALKGDVNVTLSGNQLQQSCQANFLVSLSRHTTALGLTSRPYLRNSNFTLSLNGNVEWADAWFSNPAGLGNTLTVDGQTVMNGARQSYDASRTCASTTP